MTATRKGSRKPNVRLQRQGREMYRRLCAALRYGVWAGEMGLVQVRHVEYSNWKITLPWPNAKGGKLTGRDEAVWVMRDRLRKVLEERKPLGPDAYVFGSDLRQHVTAFGKAWEALFAAVGLHEDLVWHDVRHEFVSSLIDEGRQHPRGERSRSTQEHHDDGALHESARGTRQSAPRKARSTGVLFLSKSCLSRTTSADCAPLRATSEGPRVQRLRTK
jgi:hypothetical protein